MNKYIEIEKKNTAREEKMKRQMKHFNLSSFIYVFIFCYLIFCVISFTTSKKINYTVAEVSKIEDIENMKGLIIRNERVYSADRSGNTTFFYPEGARVQKDALLVTIDEDGMLTNEIQKQLKNSEEALAGSVEFSDNDYKNLSGKLRKFVLKKDNHTFSSTYNAKYEVQKAMNDISHTLLISDGGEYESILQSVDVYNKQLLDHASVITANETGTISYIIDGVEEVDIEHYSPADIRRKVDVRKPNIEASVKKEEALFKIISSYEWYIVAEISDKCKSYIDDNKGYIKILLENDIELDAYVETYYENNSIIAEIKLDSHVENFLDKRFLDVSIIYSKVEGIKIPDSSIVEKEFYAVPFAAIENQNRKVFVRKKVPSDEAVNGETLLPIPVEIVVSDDNFSYIPAEGDVDRGDQIITFIDGVAGGDYTIQSKKNIKGVFVINQGFVEFRPVETIYVSEDYRIIKDDTSFGIKMYDRIVIDNSEVEENDYIY